MARLDRLDHLRAVAAFLVITWHFTQDWPYEIAPGFRVLSILKQGHTGVSLFCVISGFILTTIYAGREGGFASFYRNRLLRIAPLFLFIVFVSYYASDWDAGTLVITSLTGLVRGGLPSYAGPGWTVLVECQFYLLFPFLLIFSKRYGTRYLVGLLLAFILTRAAVWSASGTVQLVAYYSIFGRMDQFLIGMMAALIVSAPNGKAFLEDKARAIATFVIGVSAAIAFFWWFEQNGGLLNLNGQPWPNKSALWIFMPSIEGLTYALVVAGYLHLPVFPYTHYSSAALAHVGRVSYSIYLIHLLLLPAILKSAIAIGIVPTSWETAVLVTVFFAMPILVAASSVSYYAIEFPFMDLRKKRQNLLPQNVTPIERTKAAAGS